MAKTFLAGMSEKSTGYENLFWEADKDRSGTLTMDELDSLLKKSGYTLSRPELEARFAGMDKNNDGLVSYDEYLRAMGASPMVVHRQAFYRRKFNRYDVNRDGVVTMDELREVFASLGCSQNEAYVREVFAQCDKDGTGKLEYEEFIKYFCT